MDELLLCLSVDWWKETGMIFSEECGCEIFGSSNDGVFSGGGWNFAVVGKPSYCLGNARAAG